MATEGSFVDLEFQHFLVGINKVLIFVLIFKAVFEGELLDVLASIQRCLNLADDGGYFLDIGP